MSHPRVAVTGFGRCGSTMLMHMLRAGGIPFAPGADPHSGEHHNVHAAMAAASPGRVVKVLDPTPGLWTLDSSWQAIWMDRDPRWQAESLRKFLAAVTGSRPTVRETRALRESLERDRPAAVAAVQAMCPTLVLSYEDVLSRPATAAAQLQAFLPWVALDLGAMVAAVHDRSPRTLPDLAFELSGGDARPLVTVGLEDS